MKKNNIADRLKRFESHINPTGVGSVPSKKLRERYRKMADSLGGAIISRPAGQYCLVKRLYDFDYQHGSLKLSDFRNPPDLPLEAFQVRSSEETVSPSSLLFFDTETTGLGWRGGRAISDWMCFNDTGRT